MFSLIISIIAIALVAALALASIYYGGDAFQKGSAGAEASTIVNQGQQIQAAMTMAAINEDAITDLTELSDSTKVTSAQVYLKEVPKVRGESWTLDSNKNEISIKAPTEAVCLEVEKRYNSSATTVPASATEGQRFGCFGSTDAYTAFYNI